MTILSRRQYDLAVSFIEWRELTERFSGKSSFGSRKQEWPDAPVGGWEVELVWTEIEGRAECVGMALLGDGSEPLTASTLRRLPLGTLITENRRRALERAKAEMTKMQVQEAHPIWVEGERVAVERLTTPRRRYDPAHYERVAAAYDEAIAAGIPPTAHVQTELRLQTRTQAAKQVARARERGLLPPTEQRVAKGNV